MKVKFRFPLSYFNYALSFIEQTLLQNKHITECFKHNINIHINTVCIGTNPRRQRKTKDNYIKCRKWS